MQNNQLTDKIFYIGADDADLDIFEGQYLLPHGVSYNSYLIRDEKIAVTDTVDIRKTAEWFANMEKALNGATPDYLVVLHMEPDHAANIESFLKKYPTASLVTNAKVLAMIPQFFENLDLNGRSVVVAEGDKLSLGSHTLSFVMAPMVHWPEVMVAYEEKEKILFSADAFGKFGTLDTQEDWTDEARRYFINIVGKFGLPVQTLLKKAATLDIRKIFPLHGPMLTENLPFYLEKYQIWSSYEPEEKGVLIAYASVYGQTKKAAERLKEKLQNKGVEKVIAVDLTREDMAEAVANAFRFDKLVLASVTYDGGLFPCMENFIRRLKSKNYQNRTVGLIENGSWAPVAARLMKAELETQKNMRFAETVVSIRSALKTSDDLPLEHLADDLR